MFNFLSTAVDAIGGADGPTTVAVSGNLPLPAITVSAFAVLFIAYVYIMKSINAKKHVAEAPAAGAPAPAAAPAVTAPVYTGPVLEGVSDKEAAVIMAIVSDKTGIPLNRLKFKSIRLTEDK